MCVKQSCHNKDIKQQLYKICVAFLLRDKSLLHIYSIVLMRERERAFTIIGDESQRIAKCFSNCLFKHMGISLHEASLRILVHEQLSIKYIHSATHYATYRIQRK